MHLRAPENDTTPRQEPYLIVAGQLPSILDGALDAPRLNEVPDDTLKAYLLELYRFKGSLLNRIAAVAEVLEHREQLADAAHRAEVARIRAWADEVQANVTRALGVA